MLHRFSDEKKGFGVRSAADSEARRRDLMASAKNSLVKVVWDVIYDSAGRDIIIEAKVSLVSDSDSLLQVWLENGREGIWNPEIRPWVASVVEFTAEQNVRSARLGMIDSKWRSDDEGARYVVEISGLVMRGGKVESFFLAKEYVFEGG